MMLEIEKIGEEAVVTYFRHYPDIYLEKLETPRNILSHDSANADRGRRLEPYKQKSQASSVGPTYPMSFIVS
jgi:hypothetical protein